MSRILIVEDEARIAAFVDKGLRANGFTTRSQRRRPRAPARRRGEFDLVILDVGLPGPTASRCSSSCADRGRRLPVVMLTARDDVDDTVAGLEGGADDYLTKPFRFEELLRASGPGCAAERRRDGGDEPRSVGDLVLDLRTRRSHVDGEAVELSAREFALAETFFRHPGQVLSREQLLSHGVGLRLRPRLERRRRLRRLPAQEDRQRPDLGDPRMGYRLEKGA